ncbi:Uncharacterised protein [Mycobacteroides abscessus subsp. abscessus]|nr:Uncharacterised protein [Mycobacteroides abscessus subsp. abscessus]SIB19171.1 Uncharacterised protein [Mycobacteroides abscessus subsp. abscessus]SIB95036.1 Uncharacterised protein [Mycobacteroides abscessus subsp. abscessus]SIC48983.1 Uncharacterised protein [Mycobacteroides abscessus subsp. abscessus]SIC55471.1 Uncharacterised protein [Mycobacteroides abscessus subsp. abscessus]
MPNTMTSTGIHATAGTGINVKAVGSRILAANGLVPITAPARMPTVLPMAKPIAMRRTLTHACSISVPSIASLTNASSESSGPATSVCGRTPLTTATCHATTSPIGTASASTQLVRRSKNRRRRRGAFVATGAVTIIVIAEVRPGP